MMFGAGSVFGMRKSQKKKPVNESTPLFKINNDALETSPETSQLASVDKNKVIEETSESPILLNSSIKSMPVEDYSISSSSDVEEISHSMSVSMSVSRSVVENREVMFSARSLIPLGAAIQEKYDVKFSEGFPYFVDASLEANSLLPKTKLDLAENNFNQTEKSINCTLESCHTLHQRGDALLSLAEEALENTKKTRKEFDNLVQIPHSFGSYILVIMLFIINLLKKLKNVIGNIIQKSFRIEKTQDDDTQRDEK